MQYSQKNNKVFTNTCFCDKVLSRQVNTDCIKSRCTMSFDKNDLNQKVIYSLNLDLANKCVPQKNSTAPLAVHTSSFNTLLPLSMSVNDWNFLHLLFFRYFILLNTKRRLKNYPSYIIIEIKKELIGYKTSDCLSR